MSRKDRLENNPAKAGEMECYRCGHRIGDAEYRVTQDGCVAHYQCQMEAKRRGRGKGKEV